MKNQLEVFNFNGSELSVLIGKEGEPLFIAADVCRILGLTNPTESLRALDDDEKLTSETLRAGQRRKVNFVTESGLYSLIFRSNKTKAKSFKKWVTSEVLPSIRKTGKYSTEQIVKQDGDIEAIVHHVNRDVQIQNSKDVNAYHYIKGGVSDIVNHNRKNCYEHTGKLPSELISYAKLHGVPSKHRTSGKEVVRYYKPEVAASMSLTDELVFDGGLELKEAVNISKAVIPALKALSRIRELKKKNSTDIFN